MGPGSRLKTCATSLAVCLATLPARALHDTRLTRRHVMKGLLLLLGAGGGWQLWQSETGEGLRADYRTAKGTVSRQQLEDGSLLTLNTQSAADVRFDAHQRTVRLWYGEIAITTAKDALQRPFRVLTRQGQLTALGTEFTVRQQDNFTQLDVQQHAVEVLLASAPAQKRIVNAGESLQFSASEFGAVKPLDDESTSWTKDILSFSDKPLGEVIATLTRYRQRACCAAIPPLPAAPERDVPAEKYRCDPERYRANASR